MRYQPAHAAKSGSVPFMLRGPKSVRTVLSAAVAGVVGLVPTVLVASPAMAAVTAGTYSIADASGAEGGSVTFTITRTAPSVGNTLGEETLTWATSDGDATAGADYTAVTTGSITFPAYTNTASAQTRTITVQTLQDTTDEADDEDFVVTLSKPGGSPITLSDATATGTIVDDDNPTFTLAATPNPVNESLASDAARQATITATLSKTSTSTITIPISTSNGTATAGQDYTAVDDVITIDPGDPSGTIKVPVLDDEVDEPAIQSFTVNTTAGANVAGTQSATVNIADNDAAPVMKIAAAGNVTEGGTLTFAATLVGTSENTVTARWDTKDGPVVADDTHGIAKAGDDYTAVASGTVTFAAGATTPTTPITVKTLTDNVDEIDEDLQVKLSEPSNATLFTTSAATGTIQDSGTTLGPQVTLAPTEITEGSATTSRARTFKVTLSKASGREQQVGYAVADGTGNGGTIGDAEDGKDFAATTGTLTFAAGETEKTFTVDVIGDNVDEASGENMLVTLTDVGGGLAAGLSLGGNQVTITDDDAKPIISLNKTDITMPEGDGPSAVLFEIKLSNPSAKAIDWTATRSSTPAGTAAEVGDAGSDPGDDDYEELTALTGTFDAGTTSQYVLFVVNGDEVFEPAETIRYTIVRDGVNEDEATGGPLTAQVTLTNDDAAPQLEVTSADATEGKALTLNGLITGVAQGDTPLNLTLVGKAMDGKAAASAADFTPTSFTITIPGGTATGTNWAIGSVTIADDDAAEPAETILVSGVGFGNTGSVKDGVITIAASDTDAQPGDISLKSSASYRLGVGSLKLSGTALASTELSLMGKPIGAADDAEWESLGTTTSDEDGAYSFSPKFTTTGWWFKVTDGDNESDAIKVYLKQDPDFYVRSSSKGAATLSVFGDPRVAGLSVRLLRANSDGTWSTVGTGRLNSEGKYIRTLTGLKSGKSILYKATVYGDGDVGMLTNTSHSARVTIR
ncbi:Calx-beta domain-containing protein [Actinoplanes sp. NPDC051475]|uniref:Calx-beta domain-containing protein n=1 Tax=Actinoplanes sp. NPDC051475 TaxID=3157225 RepID=UPI00344F6704